MGKIIKAAEIEQQFPGTGRHIGQKVGEVVEPGDTVDFENFGTVTNSFADQLIIAFLAKHNVDDLKRIHFRNTPPLLKVLLKRAAFRRTKESPSANGSRDTFSREQLVPVS